MKTGRPKRALTLTPDEVAQLQGLVTSRSILTLADPPIHRSQYTAALFIDNYAYLAVNNPGRLFQPDDIVRGDGPMEPLQAQIADQVGVDHRLHATEQSFWN